MKKRDDIITLDDVPLTLVGHIRELCAWLDEGMPADDVDRLAMVGGVVAGLLGTEAVWLRAVGARAFEFRSAVKLHPQGIANVRRLFEGWGLRVRYDYNAAAEHWTLEVSPEVELVAVPRRRRARA